MMNFITKNKKNFLNKILIFTFWIFVWQIIYLIIQRDIYVPSPFNVFLRLTELVFMSSFWKSIAFSMYRVFIGLLLSILLGIIFGIISSMNKYIYELILPIMTIIRSTPVLSFIIIALIWFSSSNVPIFICFLMCFPIIWTNILTGIKNVDIKLLEMAGLYRVRGRRILKEIYIPSVMPYFTAACINCLGLGWKASVAAEVLSHPRYAIGSHLHSAKAYLDTNELFAWTMMVILLSLLFENLFAQLIRRLTMGNIYKTGSS